MATVDTTKLVTYTPLPYPSVPDGEKSYIAGEFSKVSMAIKSIGQILGNVAAGASVYLVSASNLSDLASAATARTNLGLGSIATLASTLFLRAANNLSDLASAATARTNLGLGSIATFASSAYLATASNLSDLASAATARTNLGLGSAALGTLGTAASNVVQLDGSGALPAVSGAALTSLPSQTGRLVAGTSLVMNPYAVNSAVTQAHGLGVFPAMVYPILECLSAEIGYSVGDQIGGVAAVATFWTASADATNQVLNTYPSATPAIMHKTTHVATVITASKWKLTLVPYKLT